MVFDGGELKNNWQFKNSSSIPEAEWCDQSNNIKKEFQKMSYDLYMIKYSKKSWFRRIKEDGFPI